MSDFTLIIATWYLLTRSLAMRWIHLIHWVHRDLSIGNILVVDDHAKISDWEYAANERDESTRGDRTLCIVHSNLNPLPTR